MISASYLFGALLQAVLELAAILAAATSADTSSVNRRLLRRRSGTWFATMSCASPSTTAVLPTAGSPMSSGLFFWRREHLHRRTRLARTADDWIELAVGCLLGKVGAELLEHAIGGRPHRIESAAAAPTRALPHQIVQAPRLCSPFAQAVSTSAVPSPRTMPRRCSVEM